MIRALIVAIRQWQVIPKALLFDNGSPFKGMLISTFCRKLGIRLIHSAVRHPQTNGRLERAFQDDMRDFYRQYDAWLLDHLRHDLPSYVQYRNSIRGHRALGGKPSITRLQECTEKAPAHILDQSESYAVYEVGRQKVNMDGSIRVLGCPAQLDSRVCGQEVTMYETLRWRQRHRRGDGISYRITSSSDSSALPLPGTCQRALIRKMSGVLSANGCRIVTVALYTFSGRPRHAVAILVSTR
jgi:Integrase core domain